MEITIPTSSAKLVDILSKTELAKLKSAFKNQSRAALYTEVKGGDVFWDVFKDTDASITGTAKIKEGDIFEFPLGGCVVLENITFITAAESVTVILEPSNY